MCLVKIDCSIEKGNSSVTTQSRSEENTIICIDCSNTSEVPVVIKFLVDGVRKRQKTDTRNKRKLF